MSIYIYIYILQFATNYTRDPKADSEIVESFCEFYYKMVLSLRLTGDESPGWRWIKGEWSRQAGKQARWLRAG